MRLLILLSLLVAPVAMAGMPAPKPLCGSYLSSLPDDVRPVEEELTLDEAMGSLDFLQREILDRLQAPEGDKTKQCKEGCTAGIPWEMLHIGAPNAMKKLEMVLMRLGIDNMMLQAKISPGSVSEAEIDKAVEAYCKQVTQGAYAD